MSILSSARDALRTLDSVWIDRVTAILRNGITLSEHASGELLAFRWNSDAPPTVLMRGTTKPLGILVIAARLPTASVGAVISGVPTTWEWQPTSTQGRVKVTAIGTLAASTDYDVTAWAVGG